MTIAPTLATKRLTLRAVDKQDVDMMMAMRDAPVIRDLLPDLTVNRRDTWHRLLRIAGSWVVLGYGGWTVVETATGRIAGGVGFFDHQEPPVAALADMPEAGWIMAAWARGQGMAGEAMAAALGWIDRSLATPGVFCRIHPDNAPSLALARRAGFADYDTTAGDLILFRKRHGDVSRLCGVEDESSANWQ